MPTDSFNTNFVGYQIISNLGKGNAQVRKARHIKTGDLVAIKHFTIETNADTLRRFQQESRIMTDIKHPNIVAIREVCLNAKLPYIVMDLVEGGDLRKVLNEKGVLSIDIIISLGLQVADALKTIHEKGVVHRDIKPENILYRSLPDGQLHFLLTDFGIAKIREQPKTITGQSLMTFDYASPEQFDTPELVNKASDFYSLGVVLYECMTGRVPFESDKVSFRKFLDQIMASPPPPIEADFPVRLKELVYKLLSKKADERLSDVSDLKHELTESFVDFQKSDAGQAQAKPSTASSHKQTMPSPKRKITEDKPNKSTLKGEPIKKTIYRNVNILKEYYLVWVLFAAVFAFIVFSVYQKITANAPKPASTSTQTTPLVTDNLAAGIEAYKNRDFTKAFRYYLASAKEGNAEGKNKLGLMYKNGYGVKKNYEKAIKWLRESADEGNSDGQVNMGLMYKYGNGIEKSYEKAVELFRLSADQGNSNGMNNLGLMYEKGLGVELNYDEAANLYKKAVKKGNMYAQNNLGQLYEKGLGVEQDLDEAIRLYKLSDEQGFDFATRNLKRLQAEQ